MFFCKTCTGCSLIIVDHFGCSFDFPTFCSSNILEAYTQLWLETLNCPLLWVCKWMVCVPCDGLVTCRELGVKRWLKVELKWMTVLFLSLRSGSIGRDHTPLTWSLHLFIKCRCWELSAGNIKWIYQVPILTAIGVSVCVTVCVCGLLIMTQDQGGVNSCRRDGQDYTPGSHALSSVVSSSDHSPHWSKWQESCACMCFGFHFKPFGCEDWWQ